MHERLSTSAEWVEWFRANARSTAGAPGAGAAEFTDDERRAVGRSIQGFQLGESSEGRHLLDRARAYAARSGDADYAEAVRLFIIEEQRHARHLATVLACEGLPVIRRTWADTAFRRIRRMADLELSIAVLVTAEVIAQVYYRALRDATRSARLRGLCERILDDEEAHVRFQAERLAILRGDRSRLSVGTRAWLHRGFLGGTCLVVWLAHAPALRAGGFGFGRFWSEAQRALGRVLDRIDAVLPTSPSARGQESQAPLRWECRPRTQPDAEP
jgi:hypothetical protein